MRNRCCCARSSLPLFVHTAAGAKLHSKNNIFTCVNYKSTCKPIIKPRLGKVGKVPRDKAEIVAYPVKRGSCVEVKRAGCTSIAWCMPDDVGDAKCRSII